MKTLTALILSLVLLLIVYSVPVCAQNSADSFSLPLEFDETVVITPEERAKIETFVRAQIENEYTIHNPDAYTIDQIKVVYGFDGSVYYCIECSPTGYFMYCPDAKQYLEYTTLGPSPYVGYEDFLCYAGMLEYYVFVDGVYYNPVTERTLAEEDIPAYIEFCRTHYESIMESAAQYAEDTIYAEAFHDVGDHWSRKDISRCIQHGTMVGTSENTFSPDCDLTRGMLITILYRITGSPQVTLSHPFTDVADDRYYSQAVAWAYQNDITNGTSSNTFSPAALVTRDQAVRMLYRYSDFADYTLTETDRADDEYPDLWRMEGESLLAWTWAINTHVINGQLTQGEFYDYYLLNIQDNITRAETAAIINRLQTEAGRW